MHDIKVLSGQFNRSRYITEPLVDAAVLLFCFPSEICSACATSRFRKAAEWTIYVLQQTVVFAVSASGACKPLHSVKFSGLTPVFIPQEVCG